MSFVPYNVHLVSISVSNKVLSTNIATTRITSSIRGIFPMEAGATSTATMQGSVWSNSSYAGIKIVVRFFTNGTQTEIYKSWNCTNSGGNFTITGITAGTYDVGIKSDSSISTLRTNQTFTAGNTTTIAFGALLRGDLDGNDAVVAPDYSILSGNFNKVGGCYGYAGNWTVCGGAEVTPAISNTPESKAFGILDVNSTSNTTLDYFTVSNTGNCAINVTIQATDFTGGGATWTLSDNATPGENTYGINASVGGTGSETVYSIIRKNPPYNTLTTSLDIGANVTWGLQLLMPTSVTGYNGQEMNATITLIASEA